MTTIKIPDPRSTRVMTELSITFYNSTHGHRRYRSNIDDQCSLVAQVERDKNENTGWHFVASVFIHTCLMIWIIFIIPVISITIHWLLDWSKLIDKKVVPTYCGLIESRWQGWVTVSKITSFLSYQACDYIVCVFTHVVDLTLIECHFNID